MGRVTLLLDIDRLVVMPPPPVLASTVCLGSFMITSFTVWPMRCSLLER
jgi:hypothetical protein